MNDHSNSGGNNNSNEQQQEDMNEKSNKWNYERCPQQLRNNNDMTNTEELQAFYVNFYFRDASQAKAGVLMVAFLPECLLKDNSVIFYPTNRQTPPKLLPFCTKETLPQKTDKFLQFFHTHLNEKGMNTFFLVKSNITTMQLQGCVLPFMKLNNV